MELFVARHGETDYNKQKRWQGSGIDSPLTPLGVEQAKILGKSLEGMEFDAIYSSPLKRAMVTACIAFNDLALFEGKGVTDVRLREIGLGEAEGMSYKEVSEKFSETFRTLMYDPVAYVRPLGGEAIQDVIVRVDSFLQELAAMPHKRVFVQTHGYVMRIIYACSQDKSLEAVHAAPRFNNCELWKYIYDDVKRRFEIVQPSGD